jgi:hypothetical protein
VELVHRALQQGFRFAGGPEHRVAGDAAIDPAGRIALKQRVGNRRDDEVGAAERRVQHLLQALVGQVVDGDAADQVFGELLARHFVEPRPHLDRRADAHVIGRNAAVENESARIGKLESLRQQIVQVEHFDAAFLHLQDEIEMVLLRLMDPQHVVEQKRVAVARREALMGHAGPAHHDRVQLPDLRMNSQLVHRLSPTSATNGGSYPLRAG